MQYCPSCGAAFADAETWPRHCQSCGKQQFRNPIPVSVVLMPVDRGVLTIRRAIPPALGKLALPGGFVNWGETWQEAGAREVLEETGITISPDELTLLGASSVAEGVVLIFSVARRRTLEEAAWRTESAEISEIVVVDKPCELAFSTHTDQLAAFFARG
jgi:ADP-ribose pyrophosphatase YjhB (NUDIX family)